MMAATAQPFPEDHPLTITARYYEACLDFMRGNGHKTEIVDEYFQGRYLVHCTNPGCHATLFVMAHEGTVLHHGRGADARCPLVTYEANQGKPVGLPDLWRRQQENSTRFMEEIGNILGGISKGAK